MDVVNSCVPNQFPLLHARVPCTEPKRFAMINSTCLFQGDAVFEESRRTAVEGVDLLETWKCVGRIAT